MLPLQRQHVEGLGALGGIDEQHGHAVFLLLRRKAAGAKIPQRQVAGAVRAGVGTVVTGRAHEQPAGDAPSQLALAHRRVVPAAALEFHPEPPLPVTVDLAAELHRHGAVLLDVGHGLHQPLPHAGAAHTAARHIAGQKPLRMLAQIAVQSVHLTGRAGEQHLPPLIQIEPHLLIGVAHVALHRLRAPQTVELMDVFHRRMHHPQVAVQRRAEYHAAALQHILRQRGERAAAGGLPPHRRVAVPHGEYLRRRPMLPLLQHRTHMGAVSALDAAVRYLRVEEPFFIRHHVDGPLGAAAAARTAARASVAWCKLGHIHSLCHGVPPPDIFLPVLYHAAVKNTSSAHCPFFGTHLLL